MPCRLYVERPLEATGAELTLPPEAARHVQVLRLQPGDVVTVFNGGGGEWQAEVLGMGRKDVSVRLLAALPDPGNELPLHVTLAVGMPANERMDNLVEKATELGAAALQPLHCARSVLRLTGERADKRRAHWQGVAVAASEQSGRTRVPEVAPVNELSRWLAGLAGPPAGHAGDGRDHHDHQDLRGMLSLAADAQPLGAVLARWKRTTAAPATAPLARITLLSGPEGGLAPEEEALARAAGFVPLSLGRRVLRADTAPLAALAVIGALS